MQTSDAIHCSSGAFSYQSQQRSVGKAHLDLKIKLEPSREPMSRKLAATIWPRNNFGTCGRNNTVRGEHLEYLWGLPSGDWGQEPLRQPRAPGAVILRSQPPGALTNANPSRT